MFCCCFVFCFLFFIFLLFKKIFYIYFYIYIYNFVCVCVCVFYGSFFPLFLCFFCLIFFLISYIVYYKCDCSCIDKSMQIVLERGSIDKPLTFSIGLLQFIFHTSVFTIYMYVHMHAKVISIQIFQYFRQIPPRVCTLVLFIYVCNYFLLFLRLLEFYNFG